MLLLFNGLLLTATLWLGSCQAQKSCVLSSLLNDIVRNSQEVNSCDIQFVGDVTFGEDEIHCPFAALKRPISFVDRVTATRVSSPLLNTCKLVVLDAGSVNLTQYVSSGLRRRRVRLDYLLVLVRDSDQLPDIPTLLRSFDNAVVIRRDGPSSEVVVYGIGALMKERHFMKPLARWFLESGFEPSFRKIFLNWRSIPNFKLEGVVVRASFSDINLNNVITTKNGFEGTDVEIVRTVARHRSYTVRTVPIPKLQEASSFNTSSGQFGGIVGMVASGATDMGVASVVVIYNRYQVVDYLPIPNGPFSVGVTFYTPLAKPHITWYGVLAPLKKEVWIGGLVTCAGFFVSVFVFFRDGFDVFYTFSFILSSVTSMGTRELIPRRFSQLVLLLFWCMPALVLFFAYCCNLMASLTVSTSGNSIDSWDQIIKDNYMVIMDKTKVFRSYFQSATDKTNPTYAKVYSMMKAQNQDDTFIDVNYESVQQAIKENPKTAVVSYGADYSIGWDSNGIEVMHQRKDLDYAYFATQIMRKNHPYYDIIYSDVAWLFATGATATMDMRASIVKGTFAQSQKMQLSQNRRNGDTSVHRLRLDNLQGAFYIIALGWILSCVAHLVVRVATVRRNLNDK